LPDESDRPFLDVAVTGAADALITGNTKHFPMAGEVPVLTPRAFLQRFEAKP